MSNGVRYNVEVAYTSTGDLARPNAQLGSMHAKIGMLSTGLIQAGGHVSKLGDSILGLVGSTFAVVGAAGAIGAAFAVVKTGILEVNAEIEEAQISLASVFLAGGETKNFNDSLLLSSKIISEMRKDAAALPGTFSDLSHIMQTIATPGMQSGMDAGQLEKFAAKTMAVGEILQVGSKMAGREMAHLLGPGGHLTKQNVFGQRLLGGIDTKEFNAKSSAEKLELITAGLDKHKEGIAAFGESFKGMSTTFQDHLKLFAGASTAGLFERIKESLGRANNWFSENKETLAVWARTIGDGLVSAFEKAKVFAMNMTTYLLGLWETVGTKIQGVATLLGDFLTDASGPAKLISGIKDALALGLALKATGTGLQMAGTGMKIAGGLGLPAMESGPIGAAAAAIALASLASVAIAVSGEMSALADDTSRWHIQASTAFSDLSHEVSRFTEAFGGNKVVWETIEMYGVIFTSTVAHLIGGINDLIEPVRILYNMITGHRTDDARDAQSKYDIEHPAAKEPAVIQAIQLMGNELGGHEDKRGANNTPPNHNTTIHKVEIIVNSNQDPSRIARLTVDKLAQFARHPTASPGVNNFAPR